MLSGFLARPQIVEEVLVVTRLSHLFLAATAVPLSRRRRGLEKESGEARAAIPLPPLPPVPHGGTPVAPPTPPSCYSGSNQHKMPPVPGSRFFTAQSTVGKGSRALAPEGRQQEGGRNRIRESRGPRSERHSITAQLRTRTATLLTAQACCGLFSSPPGAHFHFRSSTCTLNYLLITSDPPVF